MKAIIDDIEAKLQALPPQDQKKSSQMEVDGEGVALVRGYWSCWLASSEKLSSESPQTVTELVMSGVEQSKAERAYGVCGDDMGAILVFLENKTHRRKKYTHNMNTYKLNKQDQVE